MLNSIYSYTMTITLKDTVMFTPNATLPNMFWIWVPLGYLTWTLSMSATSVGVSPANPTGWALGGAPTTSPDNYAASTSFPTWSDSIAYLNATYGWVQTAP